MSIFWLAVWAGFIIGMIINKQFRQYVVTGVVIVGGYCWVLYRELTSWTASRKQAKAILTNTKTANALLVQRDREAGLFDLKTETKVEYAEKEGVLTRRGSSIPWSWKPRYFHLHQGSIRYYDDISKNKLKKTLSLESENETRVASKDGGQPDVIELVEKDREHCFIVVTLDRKLSLQAKSAEEKKEWMEAIKKNIEIVRKEALRPKYHTTSSTSSSSSSTSSTHSVSSTSTSPNLHAQTASLTTIRTPPHSQNQNEPTN